MQRLAFHKKIERNHPCSGRWAERDGSETGNAATAVSQTRILRPHAHKKAYNHETRDDKILHAASSTLP